MSVSRVLSVRFTDEEYQALQSMSMVTGSTTNALIRRAVNEMADRAPEDPDFLRQTEELKSRLSEAGAVLRARVSA
ncbi:hypothetical protein G7070_07040 [Propioniciclava coleopterorum]|uniref:Ribbon-helix-helix protein, copG family n=1 Tax=Propioniciclava coleopterorum TaxID=2714937 RepID=A0A6G7Y5W0_9ACTN|nr:hypothetical protein [Propioniciclava coleopterorum]QIK72066.1 hypothetical protein G7070_07040 [Propioniciclava coleopterorum]